MKHLTFEENCQFDVFEGVMFFANTVPPSPTKRIKFIATKEALRSLGAEGYDDSMEKVFEEHRSVFESRAEELFMEGLFQQNEDDWYVTIKVSL